MRRTELWLMYGYTLLILNTTVHYASDISMFPGGAGYNVTMKMEGAFMDGMDPREVVSL